MYTLVIVKARKQRIYSNPVRKYESNQMKFLFVPRLTVIHVNEWVSFNSNQLTIEDRDIITKGECLNDKHINLAQEILKHQFAHLSGLKSTLFLHKLKVSLPATNSLQIIHSQGRNH